MAASKRQPGNAATPHNADSYRHPDADNPLRPEIGTQSQFRKKRPPATYRYDSSLSPALDWDDRNPARERAEALISDILETDSLPAAKAAAAQLKALSRPFLNWTGKAERLSFEVPTLPLFVHERLSTKAIIETLKAHRKPLGAQQLNLFADPQRSIADQVLKAYEYRDQWVNRMILGDSLVVMNSLLHYESLGGQVQMIYMDPPYGVKFGSNFQPFVRKRDVSHNDDEDMTREPEMVKAYRDTWELGLHSYLTYLRDRLLVARELLTPSGSIFVQISDENLHHVREVMDEVFGEENFVAIINFKTMMPLESGHIESVVDYLCWYAKEKNSVKYRNLYMPKHVGAGSEFVFTDSETGDYRRLTKEEITNFDDLDKDFNIFKRSDLASSGYTPSCTFPIEFNNHIFETKRGKSWRTTPEGIQVLKQQNRLFVLGSKIYYKMYLKDFGYSSLTNQWNDTIEFSGRIYAVQTTATVIQRCLLMTTDPGDLVIDPTCGSGTTAYVAEQWGRRWITADISRVPLALARQRVLTATFPWYRLRDETRGPAGGFVYERKQNRKGEEIGGIVPHITLKSIANDEPPVEEVLVDRPEEAPQITRVSGPFCVEATIPAPADWEALQGDVAAQTGKREEHAAYIERMMEVLRSSPVLILGGGKSVVLKNVRLPTRTLSLSAEALVSGADAQPVAFVFGPENGAVTEKLVYEAAKEASAKRYVHLHVIGFAIQPNARVLIESCDEAMGIAASYVQATPDLLMGDLLKNMRSSQIFSVCGLPEVALRRMAAASPKEAVRYQAELLGFDVFDPITMAVAHRSGDDVPAWLLDTDYNGMCFHVCQAFFPRTGAWDSLKKALKSDFDESVWSHLAGSVSAPFEAGEHDQIAVKVIDDRGNELLVVKKLTEAQPWLL